MSSQNPPGERQKIEAPAMRIMELATFKTHARTQKHAQLLASVPVLRKTITGTASVTGTRSVKYILSTDAEDRDHDKVNQAGWDLKPFRQNPVIFFNHAADQLPVAKCTWIGLEEGKLKGVAEFVPADMPVIGALAEAIFRMCKTGFLSATSVGFIPTDYEIARDRDDGSFLPPVNFNKQTLAEWSICGLPANPEALIEPGQREPGTAPLDSAKGAGMTEEQRRELSRKFQRARLLARIM